MLAVVLFLSIFVLLAFGVFFVGIRGGVAGARATLHGQTHGVRGFMNLSLTVVYLGFGVVMPILLLTGNHANASASVGGMRLTQADKTARTLFGEHCGVCHTLLAANAIGKVGPNLDVLRPPYSLVLNTINNGCLQNPLTATSPETCLGYGNMPAGVLLGKDAEDVAHFVAKVAGHE